MQFYIPLLFNKMYSLLNCDNEIIIHSQLCIVIGNIGYRFPDHIQGSLGLLDSFFKTLAKVSYFYWPFCFKKNYLSLSI